MKVKIYGMKCIECKKRVEKVLENIDGIESVQVSLEDETLSIKFNKNVSFDLIKEKLEEFGYEIEKV